ncbi:sporulation peptidase YabG [Clostridium massiliamazoniense]|uniref:sporulation peptidase YabG n=1 Tax=Clostridium massiliamazoniense TaxID=1347366 RepID=UPI0006D78F76|nr:sporulation peptidase YabG [Clostridium massiliamazoniense]
MKIGDYVVRKSYGKDIKFKIIDIKEVGDEVYYVLKGISIRIIADSLKSDLEEVKDEFEGGTDKLLNARIHEAIKKAIGDRGGNNKRATQTKSPKIVKDKELVFGRPGKILHIDGDATYLDNCLKVYKELQLSAVGYAIPEKEQPKKVLEIVKEVKPDIVVLTGHDGISRNVKDYLDVNNYRNSKYFIESVRLLRDYNSSYDELVIFAGACQSCYENILDAGANFASSPNRVLIHCLDPVFICEKIAYTKIDTVVSITEVIENTITGIKGIGGLQTRGKYREGYPKSPYV